MRGVVIGLTGQTGAGKSTIAAIITKLYPDTVVIDADKVSREIMRDGGECIKKLEKCFGSDITDKSGHLIRPLLAQRAFCSREKTELLNSIVHPLIIARSGEYIDAARNKHGLIIFDAPQLFESGGDRLCDITLSVTAPVDIRLKRIMKRDSLTESAALLRINAQHDEAYYKSRSDHLLDGSLPLWQVQEQAAELLNKIKGTEVLS